MNLTRSIFLALAFLIPSVATVAKAEDKPAAAADAPADAKKAKKSKKAKKEGGEEKKEEAPAPAEKK